MNAFYDPKFRRLLDWTEARREGATDAPIPFADDTSLDAVRWIESFLDAADVLARIEPPASLRQRLRLSFANQQHLQTERLAVSEILDLLADSRGDAELAGVRGLAESDTHESFQLVFGGASATVFVEVFPTSAVTVRITGQIVHDRRDQTSIRITGRTRSDSQFSTTTDEHGQFSLDSVPADLVTLEIDDGGSVVGLELDLRAP